MLRFYFTMRGQGKVVGGQMICLLWASDNGFKKLVKELGWTEEWEEV